MGDTVDSLSVQSLTIDRLSDVYAIDMREHGHIVYRVVDGRLQADVKESNRPPRPPEAWKPYVEEWAQMLRDAGAAWGAYDAQHRMVGSIVLRRHLTDEMDQLAALFVSRDHRRTGIARQLFQELLMMVRAGGARRVYFSATPSRSAIGFYRSQGFVLADEVHPELFAREPEDIHMVLGL